jgi:hypothetical protein
MGGYTGYNNPGARVWYVGASGWTALDGVSPSDGNDGTSPQNPFATIQAGLNSCVSGRGDIVAVLPGSYTITTALTMTKDDVTLCSARPVVPGQYGNVVVVDASAGSMLEIDASNCVVDGITFDANYASTNAVALIDVGDTTAAVGCTVRNCLIDMQGAATDTDGIRWGDDTLACTYGTIENCSIVDFDNTGITVGTGSYGVTIKNCIIQDEYTANIGVNAILTKALNTVVSGNILAVATAADEKGVIEVGVAAARSWLTDNYIWMKGAAGIGVFVIDTGTVCGLNNWIASIVAGSVQDFKTSSTTPSVLGAVAGVFAATPGASAFDTPTVDNT